MKNKALNRIKHIRKELKLTVRELEELSGINHSTITKVENGDIIPTQLTMLMLAKGLNLRVHEVFILDYTKIDISGYYNNQN